MHPIEFNKRPSHHDREDDINMESNPSYRMLRGEDNSNTGYNVLLNQIHHIKLSQVRAETNITNIRIRID